MLSGLLGIDLIADPYAPPPRDPTPGEQARRLVRHGLTDVLEWLGETPGALPDDLVHTTYRIGRTLLAHPDTITSIRGAL